MILKNDQLKKNACDSAIEFLYSFINKNSIIGIGTGSTVNYFIERLESLSGKFLGAVASSKKSAELLKRKNIKVFDLNIVENIPIYIDSADEIDRNLFMIKGGGGALTREKIVASVSDFFLCIIDEQKVVKQLGNFPLAIEVLPMAKSAVKKFFEKEKCSVLVRKDFITDNGNLILDVSGLCIEDPVSTEALINNIPGVVTCGLFASRKANAVLIGTQEGVIEMQ